MGPVDNKRIRLGELLRQAGVITEAQLRTALNEQKKWGGKLGSLLVEMGFLSEDLLVKALSKQLNLPRVEFDSLNIPEAAIKKLDADFAEHHQVIPVAYDSAKKVLIVAMADPEKLTVLDEIVFKTGCKVKAVLAGAQALSNAIRKHYFGEEVRDLSSEDPIDQSMKLINPLGNTMVRRLDSIVAPSEASSSSTPVEEVSAQTQDPRAAADVEDRLRRMELLQRKQVQVLKAVVELLLEKGVFSREEYRKKVDV